MQDYTIVEAAEVVSVVPLLAYGSLVSDHLTHSLLSFQVVANVHNLMRQSALLFRRLEVTEAMRAFFAQ